MMDSEFIFALEGGLISFSYHHHHHHHHPQVCRSLLILTSAMSPEFTDSFVDKIIAENKKTVSSDLVRYVSPTPSSPTLTVDPVLFS